MPDFALDSAWDLNIIQRERYLRTSSNVVLRLLFNKVWSQAHWLNAIELLLVRYPYLNARLLCAGEENYLQPTHQNIIEFKQLETTDLSSDMQRFSSLSQYCFRFRRGPLTKVVVSNDGSATMLEVGISHLLGDGRSLLNISSDLLFLLENDLFENDLREKNKKPQLQQRIAFSPKLIGLQDKDNGSSVFTAPDLTTKTTDHFVDLNFYHGKTSVVIIKKIKLWLQQEKLNAGVTDVFYWAVVKILQDFAKPIPQLAVIQSYRHLLTDKKLMNACGNFAQYSQIVQPDSKLIAKPQQWIEHFSEMRKSLVTADKVQQQYFLIKQINQLFSDNLSLQQSRNLLKNFLGGDQFTINNYGQGLSVPQNILPFVCDVDIQDEAKIQELRLISVADKLFFNLTLNQEIGLSTNDMIENLFKALTKLVDSNLNLKLSV